MDAIAPPYTRTGDEFVSDGDDDLVEAVSGEFDGNLAYGLPDFVSDSDIVPDEDQVALISIRERQTIDCFKIGDIAIRLTERALERWVQAEDKSQKRVTAQRVRAAVGRFCGKSERTVRYYAEAAGFYDDETRQRYEILPFAHFVFARSMGDMWRDVLDYSMLNPASTLADLQRVFIDGNSGSLAENLFGAEVVGGEPESGGAVDFGASNNCANIRTNTVWGDLESGAAADFIARGAPRGAPPQLKVNVFGDLLTALDRAEEYVHDNSTDKDVRREFAESVVGMRAAIARVLSGS